ncbi:MAG TPA: ATP-dependent helicase [Solirubrobacteraceae bacterium]|nr:ATP-dependent helicase [Solirubrobacteraceae bacterium]
MFVDSLNPEQRAAATHLGGPLLVLAGAGTGKTTTLAARVAWLIDEGAAPERVLLLTFTRRAAREMLARARAYLGRSPNGRHAGRVVGGTFHSVAHRFVRRHAAALGLPAGFGVLDAGDAADLLDLVRQDAGLGQTGKRFPRKSTLLDIYSRTVNAQRPLRELLAEAFPWCERHGEDLGKLFVEYGARKRSLGVIDLDDLLLHWRALACDPVVGGEMGRAVDHLLIDEYQDVNGLQVDLVRALRAERRDVTVVGDDLQAIYGFRAASARHILDFPEHFPGAAVVTLERNYRATQPLLDVANAVADQAERAYPRQLRAERIGGGAAGAAGSAPELVFCLDEAAQAGEVCDRVLDARERGAALREQAVLMRASHDSDLLELELARRDIPYVKYGGLRYLEAAHVKDFLALLRLADNPADRLSWFRWLQLLDGVGPAIARRVLEALEPDSGGLGEVLGRWPAAQDALPAEARQPGAAVIAALSAVADERAAGVRAERLRNALAPIVEAHYPDGPVRLQDLDALVAAAGQASDLGRFVADLVLDPPASSSDLAGDASLDEDWLVLSTVHSAKGLEWRAVHVLALYDGNFPSDLSAGDREAIDEERRLLYVALTRAQRELHLYVPVRYYHRPRGNDDGHGYGKPSRFLSDQVQELCRRTDATGIGVDPAGEVIATRGEPRIEVSVDALFT